MSFWSNMRRLALLAKAVTRHGVAHAVSLRGPHWLVRRWSAAQLSGPQRLRAVFEELGGTFLKFGQMLALQPDILSLEYCNELYNLLDRVAPFGFEQVKATFVAELGREADTIFEWFDPTPLATASIGQVHAACLKGRKVAVKVQRPNVERDFGGDISLMTAAIRLIRWLGLKRLSWLIEPMSEFVSWTCEELDYRQEARYMEKLGSNARSNAVERVPQVYWDYTTRRTLVMEFFEGVTVLDYLRATDGQDAQVLDRLAASSFDPNAFARNIIGNFLGDAFRHGLFHADLHPANLMILPGNVVGYIDFGITGVLSRYSRRHLIAMTLAYTRGDVGGMCESFFRVSATGPDSDVEGFREGLQRQSEAWYEVRGRERRLRKNFTLVMLDMLQLSRAMGVWPERDVIKYIRSTIACDGLITRFAPGPWWQRYLERVCNRHLSWQSWCSLLSYEAAVSWSTAGGNLLRDGALRAADILKRLSSDELLPQGEAAQAPRHSDDTPRGPSAVQLGSILFLITVFVVATGERLEFGLNLFTAEIAVAAASILLFARARRQQASPG